MNLEQLAGFVEVAATGHFTKAAAALHLAQPSLSRQISTLEKELGAAPSASSSTNWAPSSSTARTDTSR